MSSPLLWGPNNTSNNLQNQVLLANGELLSNNGPKNYIKTNNFENGLTTGWDTFLTTLTGKIPTGSLSLNPGTVSLSINSGSTISGTNSLVFSGDNSAINSYGLTSDPFTIDKSDQAKVLSFKFYYKITEATVNCSGTDSNTFAIYIRDVTANTWIQPPEVYNIVQNSGIGTATGTFQTTASSTQYRICLVIINNITGLSLIEVDDVFVGPQVTSVGPAMSNWKSYTPTWGVVSGTAPSIGNGTIVGRERRVGDFQEIEITITSGTTTTYGSGTYLFGLPTGITADTSQSNGVNVITMYKNSSPFFSYNGVVAFYSSTQLLAAGTGSSNWTNTNPVTLDAATAGHSIRLTAKYKVVGWDTNTVQSADTDTRVVAAQASASTTTTIDGTSRQVNLATIDDDSHASFSSSTYTIPVSGRYKLSACVLANVTAFTTAGRFDLGIKKNSTFISVVNTQVSRATFVSSPTNFYEGNFKAGDTISLWVQGTEGTFTSNVHNDPSYTKLTIERLSGPAIVQATETVAAKYTNTAGTAIPEVDNTILNFPTKEYDYTNSVTTGASWKFTAPVSGLYEVNVSLLTGLSTTINQVIGRIRKNGTPIKSSVATRETTISTYLFFVVETKVRLNAGDYINFVCFESNNIDVLDTGVGNNAIEITRIGN